MYGFKTCEYNVITDKERMTYFSVNITPLMLFKST